ncbi:MAG TPA: hypothetical protein VN086_02100, partial [Candidatus Paceibacterota bacterium]|nr:hypothetical protein [Candidatus Paceibacterota bacterium]
MTERARINLFKALFSTWPLLATAVTLSLLGVLTMNPFDGSSSLAPRQLIFIGIGIIVYAVCAVIDMRFIRRTPVIVAAYVAALVMLAMVLVL